MIVGKYPREVEKEFVDDGFVGERLLVILLSSNAIMKPATVITRAVIFRYQGIVIT